MTTPPAITPPATAPPAACAHGHDHAPTSTAKMACAVGLTLAFVVAEAVAGTLAHSLALLGDAGHNFADAAALPSAGTPCGSPASRATPA